MLFHTLAFNARTDRRFRRTVRIALLLLAGQMFPAAGATAEDRIGSGSVTVSDGQIYDNVYGDRSEGGDAASSGSRVSGIGGTAVSYTHLLELIQRVTGCWSPRLCDGSTRGCALADIPDTVGFSRGDVTIALATRRSTSGA